MTTRTRSFTLVELVVAMGIIVVIASLTLVAVRQVSRNTRQASGVNAVMASLDNARALAMKENKIVLVVYRPRFDGPNEMFVEAVLAEWSGQTAIIPNYFSVGGHAMVDRFVPVNGIVPRRLPRGIKVAAPGYQTGADELAVANPSNPDTWPWITQPHLPRIHQETDAGDPFGGLIGVMFAPDGTTTTRNAQTDSHFIFVDFNNDFVQQIRGATFTYSGTSFPSGPASLLFRQTRETDEVMVTIAPFVAVFDDDEARSLAQGPWGESGFDAQRYVQDLIGPNGYISTRADRIHFNRYTGVAMK